MSKYLNLEIICTEEHCCDEEYKDCKYLTHIEGVLACKIYNKKIETEDEYDGGEVPIRCNECKEDTKKI